MVESLKILMGAAALFLIMTAQGLFLLSAFKLRFELAVPISLMGDMFVLLFSGLVFSNLLIGVYLIIAFSAAALAASIIREKNRLREFLRVFCSAGFIVFAVGYIFSWVVSLPHVAYAWDDFGHWLPFVKQMVTYNKMYSDPEVYLIRHWYYTPAMQLLEYFACKLCGGYRAGVCFSIGTLMIFASLLPLVKWMEFKNRVLKYISVFIVFLSIFVTGHEDLNGYFIGFGSAYVDMQLTSVCVLLLLWGFYEKESLSKAVYMGVIAAFLSLIKVTGIMFALLGAGTYILIYAAEWIYHKAAGDEVDKKTLGFKPLLIKTIPVAAAAMVYVLWNNVSSPDVEYSSLLGVGAEGIVQSVYKFGSGLTIRTIPITLEWLRTYFYHFFTTKINAPAVLPVTTGPLLIVFVISVYLKIRLSKNRKVENVRLFVFCACISAGLLVYVLAVGLAFYSLSENLESMTSYQRYLSSYTGVIIVIMTLYLTQIVLDREFISKKEQIFVTAAIAVFIGLLIPKDIIPAIFGETKSTNDSSRENRADYYRMKKWGENVNEAIANSQYEDPKIYFFMDYGSFPDTPSLNGELAVMSYFILPTEMQEFGQMVYPFDPSLPFCDEDEWSELLQSKQFSHVMISNFSPQSMIWWKAPSTQNLSEMYDLFDVPPEELSFNSPLLFEVCVDGEGKTKLRQVIVENPII